MKHLTPKVIYCDARALQDTNYKRRGIGQHATTLIKGLKEFQWGSQRPKMVGLVDVGLPEIDLAQRRIFDEVKTEPRFRKSWERKSIVCRDWFLSVSPMTHNPVWAREFLLDSSLHKVCLFYDLIQLQFPERYLADRKQYTRFLLSLAWLKHYDRFACISRFTLAELRHKAGIAENKTFVTGVAVRPSLAGDEVVPFVDRGERRCILFAGGGDERKNPECAVDAFAASKIIAEAGVDLVLIGNYDEDSRQKLRRRFAVAGGSPASIVFKKYISDEELRELYQFALVTIVASRAEGFSIPIVESSAANTPVLASDVGAHPELVTNPWCRFDPDRPEELRLKLEKILTDRQFWCEISSEQSQIWKEYTTQVVVDRFVNGAVETETKIQPFSSPARKARPKLAVLSPLPPTLSGVADYTVASLRPLTRNADVHFFTQTKSPIWEDSWASVRPVSSAAFSAKSFDATLSIMGNSEYHVEIFDYLMSFGGACIAHDARQLGFYHYKVGAARTAEIASVELNRHVSEADIHFWLANQNKLPTLLFSDIVRAANPLLVHSSITASLISETYKTNVKVLPFAQYNPTNLSQLSQHNRAEIREQLGVPREQALICSFGAVSDDKAPLELVWTLRLLTDWGLNSMLVFCGECLPNQRDQIDKVATEIGVRDRVRLFTNPLGTAAYSKYLIAADLGIQLRTYSFGALSGALNDCIAAALPTVANESLAHAMDSPSYVHRVSDGLSSVLVAEAALSVLGKGLDRQRPIEEAFEFQEQKSPIAYCRALCSAIELDIAI